MADKTIDMKKIGILGSGIVAQTLASGFLKHGYQVKVGSGTPSKLDDWLSKAGDGASTGTFAEAAAFGDIIVLSVKGTAATPVMLDAGLENVKGKIVIDTTNPISPDAPENGVLKFRTTLESSGMEELQSEFADVRFVKAFNSVGSARMVNPEFPEGRPTMFICGNDAAAKSEVAAILDQFGWDTADFGMVESARAIEPLCMLWCIPGFLQNKWTHAFKLVGFN